MVDESQLPSWFDEMGEALKSWQMERKAMREDAEALKQRVAEVEMENGKIKNGVIKYLQHLEVCETGKTNNQGIGTFSTPFLSKPTVMRTLGDKFVCVNMSKSSGERVELSMFKCNNAGSYWIACGIKDLSSGFPH